MMYPYVTLLLELCFFIRFVSSLFRFLLLSTSLSPLCYSDQYVDPYYDYEMEAFWRGGQYENFRVQYTETPLPYHYTVSLYT